MRVKNVFQYSIAKFISASIGRRRNGRNSTTDVRKSKEVIYSHMCQGEREREKEDEERERRKGSRSI
jgi:hypothetical protein